ncbi:esterase B1-like [Drosophila albomicans]|uniref:carboxylesterase n=1 Tax=Drosophila albomicans TaxID=7291 RepID=A0A6P8WL59_DROAB|nr:esterase B1-like [Drosophila albomicans]
MSGSLETYEISLPQGQIKGTKCRTLYDDEYYSFERIPFGKPPLGELRFKAPQPADPWTGVLDCTHFGVKPVQKNMLTGAIDGNEDCLYLNVYAKQLKTKKPLPVMVYIFGGAFTVGEASRELYGPDYFMAKDVILVTFNYRVDCFGFLSLKDPSLDVPGNAGLKDQVLALKWVKKYIYYFNGDADNITIFGNSTGGCCTHYMMCTEQTRGLFHKAIPMSGTLFNYWSDTPPSDFAYRLAKFHGYDGENVDRQVFDYLRSVEPYKLVNHNLLTPEECRNGLLYPFGATVEPYVTADCVVPKSQLEMVRDAWANDLPVMLGGGSFEGLFMYPGLKANPKSMDTLTQDPHRFVPYDVRLVNTDEQILKFSEKLIKLYFGDETPSSKHVMTLLDYYSYKVYWHGWHRTLKARLAYSKAPTFYYRFDFDSPDFNFYRKKFCGNDIKSGVSHADELSYLFRNSQSWKLEKTSGEYLTIQRLVGIWTSFAAKSNPNCEEIKHVTWEPSTKDQIQRVINISNEVTIIDLPEYAKLLVWDSLYKPEMLF